MDCDESKPCPRVRTSEVYPESRGSGSADSRDHRPVFGNDEAAVRPGLTDHLRDEADESKIIQVGNQDNRRFIPGRTQVSSPSELLACEEMKVLVDRPTPLFDWVILDSPRAIAVHDASVFGNT